MLYVYVCVVVPSEGAFHFDCDLYLYLLLTYTHCNFTIVFAHAHARIYIYISAMSVYVRFVSTLTLYYVRARRHFMLLFLAFFWFFKLKCSAICFRRFDVLALVYLSLKFKVL